MVTEASVALIEADALAVMATPLKVMLDGAARLPAPKATTISVASSMVTLTDAVVSTEMAEVAPEPVM